MLVHMVLMTDASEKPPTTITSAHVDAHRGSLDPATIDLISMRDKAEVKDIVREHLEGRQNSLQSDKY